MAKAIQIVSRESKYTWRGKNFICDEEVLKHIYFKLRLIIESKYSTGQLTQYKIIHY